MEETYGLRPVRFEVRIAPFHGPGLDNWLNLKLISVILDLTIIKRKAFRLY
jgi:hypothetical protein